MPDVRIGISGWTYAPWRGTFFPRALKQNEELAYASRKVRSIEINGTFYSLQTPTSFGRWTESTPEDFLFSVKAPRYLTHIKRLKGGRAPLANFFASGVLRLGEKLGPILWQLPPSLRFDAKVLDAFLASLPRDTLAAARLARRHDAHVSRPWLAAGGRRTLRHALEVRHPSFETTEFIELLRHHDVAVVVADTAGKWPLIEDVTADFVYVRLHGDAQLYVSGYTPTALGQWARKIRAWAAGRVPRATRLVGARARTSKGPRDVYVYFDNDVKTRAPYDAMNLAHLLKLGPRPSRSPSMRAIAELPRTNWPGFGPARRAGTRVSPGRRPQ
ncbi:MAG TPA: DUF72 domain-containing protein [Lacunisphaera sp.]|nr:DUF72 domain-containing protein [Lacunisphaera sp.]